MHISIFALLLPLAISSPVQHGSAPYLNNEAPDSVPLVTFDGAEGTTYKFHVLNDPVMGGVSTGTFEVDEENDIGIFNGTVKIVPSLQAPGFLSFEADGKFADASSTISGGIALRLRTSTPEYTGFRMVFAANAISPSRSCRWGAQIPFTGGCFKSKFNVPPSNENEFVDIEVPFNTFSDHWDGATGEHTKECSEDPKVCPTADDLGNIQRISIMAEGVAGDIHLEVLSVAATTN